MSLFPTNPQIFMKTKKVLDFLSVVEFLMKAGEWP